MKLSLEELKVESYSAQVCEQELENVKGGTGWTCFSVAFQTFGVGVAIASTVYSWFNCSDTQDLAQQQSGTSLTYVNSEGDSLYFHTDSTPGEITYRDTTGVYFNVTW